MEEEKKEVAEQATAEEAPPPPATGGGGGWGRWGLSFSVISDLQKAAAAAADEISRNAAAVAQTASKTIAEMQNTSEDLESSKETEGEDVALTKRESEDENDKLRQSALEKLEKASDDSILSQGLKVFDNSVENFTSGAWTALGSAWKEGSDLVQRSAANLAGSVQQVAPATAGSGVPSLLESGKAFTAKGMQVLEYVGKETMDLLITETGIEVERADKEAEEQKDDDQSLEEMTFDRCFYIYGGPEQLEELEALSSHYALLFNRRKTKLSLEQKSLYDGKLKEVQQIFNLSAENDGINVDLSKGKKVEKGNEGSSDEMKNLHDASVRNAAEMAAGFTSTLGGLTVNDIIHKTARRLESLHSEGVHRLSEMCCFAVSQLLIIGKSIISAANKAKDEDDDEQKLNIEWPEDVLEKAKMIRVNAQTMIGYVEAVSNSFITGISDVTEAYQAAIKSAIAESHEVHPGTSIQEKAGALSEHLHSDQKMAVEKVQDGLQFLSHVVFSSSMNAAA
ncbi:uncharacterized protein LOC114732774 isoform X2 [Neltuma alba]|uniref:uncharacterized protein LOC114723774 isoform X2 n=1 Tax=Neltuma alba TaxID=207710 RepID=UPI0010A3E279|nr:uncharacterized protein LOC114723774 isoform X2 [Prosopis alba]XP_028775951.1 uncharacterized protein LOC114732774 isoform X2 [Prosopis alba]